MVNVPNPGACLSLKQSLLKGKWNAPYDWGQGHMHTPEMEDGTSCTETHGLQVGAVHSPKGKSKVEWFLDDQK